MPPADTVEQTFQHVGPCLDNYLDSANELREISRVVETTELKAESVEVRFAREAARLFPDRAAEYHQPAAKLVHAMIHERMKGLARTTTKAKAEKYQTAWKERLKGKLSALTGDPRDYWIYSEVWARVATNRWGSDVVYSSLLTSAIADFEVFISRLIQGLLQLRPQILRATEKKYGYAELEQFATMEDVREQLVQDLVEGLLRDKFESWTSWLSRQGIEVPGVTKDYNPAIIEAFQRRNILVHNGGRVNKIYLSKVASSKAKVGDRIRVSRDYIDTTIDCLTGAALKLAFATVLILNRGQDQKEEVSKRALTYLYALLVGERNRTVVDFGDWATSWLEGDSNKLSAKVNLWLARKRIDGLGVVRDEIDRWDTSALAGEFRLAKLALLDEVGEAHELAKRLIAAGDLSLTDWRRWPVLEHVRIFEAELGAAEERLDPAGFADDHGGDSRRLDLN